METILESKFEENLCRLQCELVARRNRYNPEGVNWTQYDVLDLLRINGAMSPSSLGKKLGRSRTQTSKALRSLKDLNLIEQSAGSSDRRVQKTQLTKKGEEFLSRAAYQRHGAAQLVAAAMTPGEQAIFTELCAKAVTGLEKGMV